MKYTKILIATLAFGASVAVKVYWLTPAKNAQVHESYIPTKFSGIAKVSAKVKSGTANEIEISADEGKAFVYFDPSAFLEKIDVLVVAQFQKPSTFFVEAMASLGLESAALELSPTLTVAAESGSNISAQRVRVTLPIKAEYAKRVQEFQIIAAFRYPLTAGSISTRGIKRFDFTYPVTDFATFLVDGLPLDAVIIGIPK